MLEFSPINIARVGSGNAPAVSVDGSGLVWTAGPGLRVGAQAILRGDGSQIATTTVNGSGIATWTLGAPVAQGVAVTYDAPVTRSAGIAPVVPITLVALSVSPNTATTTVAYSGTVTGKASGSTLSLSGAGAAGLSVAGSTISGTPTTAGAVNVLETLAGASNTPNPTNGAITVSVASATNAILREDGSYLLREDGSRITREAA